MATVMPHKPGPWTVDDLPDDGHRYEIVDGTLLVSPSAAPRHELVVRNLARIIERSSPHRVLAPAGVTFAPTSYRVPDVAVIRDGVDLWDAPSLRAVDVLLVVEVVSPSSVTNDRVTKRVQYAAEGVAAYWIVETEPELTMTALTLPRGADIYVEAGRWSEGESVTLDEPFPITFPVSDLRD